MAERPNRRKLLVGTVVSNRMDKTCVVRIDWRTKHGFYQKPVKQAKKYKAHDEKNEVQIGDVVRIMETRPISKDKRWVVREVLTKS